MHIKDTMKAHIIQNMTGKTPEKENETFLEKLRKLQAERLGGVEMLKKYNGDVNQIMNIIRT